MFAMEDTMTSNRVSRGVAGAMSCSVLLAIAAQAAASTDVIYSFAGDEDGEYPATELVLDVDGNLYGTSTSGGDFNAGTVFKLSPDGSGGWTKTVLHHFTGGADGTNPY